MEKEKKNKEINEKFEKRRKGVSLLLNINFIIIIIDLIIAIFLPVSFLLFDKFAYIIKDIVSLVLAFFARKSAKDGKLSAGIIGIIFAMIDLTGSLILFIMGVLLLLDSILYIKEYKK